MISTLIIRGTAEERTVKALALCEKYEIYQFDRQIFSSISTEEKESSDEKFGIAMVRKIKQRAILKPAYSKQNAILILEAQLLTLPAQQALLKLLEEPPLHTIIVITGDKESSFLPTIRSRCRIIQLDDTFQKTSNETGEVNKFLLDETITISERLELAELIVRDQPEEWIKKYIHAARQHMLQAIENNNLTILKKISRSLLAAQESYQLLTTTNSNQRLIVEQLLLDI